MRWGVIGYGSIGRRHVKNILTLQDEIVVLTKNQECKLENVDSVNELLKKKCDLIIISNSTADHFKVYSEIRNLNKSIPLLIEKPIFDKSYSLPKEDPNTFVAYCLRYHAVTKKLKDLLQNSKIISAQFYVGQYLPDWRPGRNYSETYSAKKSEGGGVLRDLSHEIDMADFLLGDLNLKYAFTNKLSQLNIDSDDTYLGVFKTTACPLITVQMNYLDRIHQRYALFITEDQTIKADFITGTIQVNCQIEKVTSADHDMYLEMLKDFRSGSNKNLCSYSSGLNVVRLMEESEKGNL